MIRDTKARTTDYTGLWTWFCAVNNNIVKLHALSLSVRLLYADSIYSKWQYTAALGPSTAPPYTKLPRKWRSTSTPQESGDPDPTQINQESASETVFKSFFLLFSLSDFLLVALSVSIFLFCLNSH